MSFQSSPKAKETHESWESLFRRTLSKERLFTSTRAAESPIHWIQLLDAFDQHDTRRACKNSVTHGDLAGNEGFSRSGHLSADKSLQSKLPEAVAALAQAAAKVSGESRTGGSSDVPPGWPLLPFPKVQTFKCEKCCLEFCSPINHRRHLRTIHRRTSQAEKEDLKSQRQQFATFWDNLSPEEAYKIAAVKTLQVEDLTGGKVVRALSHLLQQPSVFALPHSYVKSGAMLLELVQSRSSRIFSTSSELFQILDGSSEKTFPSFGLNAMQRYVFEGGAGKVGLETKNLVASLSFLVEQSLVKAFIKNKDEEAWRCQTALVEEEEASQRKQAQIQARKDMKKVRQKDKEQKVPAVATQRLSDSDLIEDETSSSFHPAGSQRGPSSNSFENLNHELAGEGTDFNHCAEIVPVAGSSSSGKSNVSLDLNDEVVSPCEGGLAIVVSKDEVVPPVGSSPLESNLELGDSIDAARIADEVGGIESATHECKTKDFPNLLGTNKGSPSDASDVHRPYDSQKHKQYAEHSPSFRGEASVFPYQKQSWEERKSLSARNMFKRTSASEFQDMGLPSSGFSPRQYVAKHLRLRSYPAAARVGGAVWTKKIRHGANATSAETSQHSDLASDTIAEVSDADPALMADTSVGVSPTSAPHDAKLDSLFISSTLACFNIEPPLCSAYSEKQASKTGFCNHESSQTALFAAGSGQCYGGGASIPPAVIGSVVIGSFDVPFESVAGQKESASTASSWRESAQVSKAIDPSEKKRPELLDPIERVTNEALLENGKNKCGSHIDNEGDGVSSKLLLQSGGEEKEHKEHSISQAGTGNLMKPAVVQGGSFAGLKTKIWRPVSSNTHYDSCTDEIFTLVANSPDRANKVPLNQNLGIAGDINNHGVMELEIDQAIQGNNSDPYYLPTSAQAKTATEDARACTLTLKAVASFLSERWSDALRSSDSVILSVEAEEDVARQCCDTTAHTQRGDSNVDLKDSRNLSPRPYKGANNPAGNATKSPGLWKQGCSGSAMAVSRRMMAKENSHLSSRYAGYRYVPK